MIAVSSFISKEIEEPRSKLRFMYLLNKLVNTLEQQLSGFPLEFIPHLMRGGNDTQGGNDIKMEFDFFTGGVRNVRLRKAYFSY
jgi:hypothetical protein